MPSLSGRPRKRLTFDEREGLLLDAAAHLVTKGGADALTMEGMAASAGVNKALAYRHFSNRDDVLLALWDRETGRFDAKVREALQDVRGLEPRVRLLVDTWLDALEAGPTALSLLDQNGIGNPELARRRSQRIAAIVRFLSSMLREEYDLAPRDADTAAAVLATGAQGLVALREATGWPRTKLTRTFLKMTIGAVEALARSPR